MEPGALDRTVFTRADLLLDSLEWDKFKRSYGAGGFLLKEVAYLE